MQRNFISISWAVSTLLIFMIIIFAGGCLDEIDLPIEPDLDEAIVIEGQLSLGNPSLVSISITRLFDFSASSLQPVNVREVLLLDEQDNTVELVEIAPGTYGLVIDSTINFQVAIGKSYRIQVNTFDNRNIISTPEPILETPKAGEVNFSLFKKDRLNDDGQIVQDDYIAFDIETPITLSTDGKAARFLWSLAQTYRFTDSPERSLENGKQCYISGNIDVTSINVLDGNQYALSSSVSAPIYETPVNYFFAEGYYLTVVQQSLSEGAYQYWNQVSQVVDRTGSFFEAPAGTIRSNFINKDSGEESSNVFGYFYATHTDTTRFYVSPEMAGSPTMYCPWPANQIPPLQGCPRFPCCECLDEIGSQLNKPDFWNQ